MKDNQLRYIDRHTHEIKVDRIHARGFLNWCYNSHSGWCLARHLFNRPLVSHIYGWYQKRRWTKRKIPGFVKKLDVDTSNCLKPLHGYDSFNDFIVRQIDLSSRPVDPDDAACVSPADARVWVQPDLSVESRFTIKSATFQLVSFLQDASLAMAYDGGALFVFRLYLGDYHHFHFPDSGTPTETRSIAGRYFAVSPYSHRWRVPYFAENHRHLTLFDSTHFGRVIMGEVGAFTVGSIRQCHVTGESVRKGAHKGYFELGGSIVVLLFEPDRIQVDDDLLANSADGLETYLRMGEPIGRVPQTASHLRSSGTRFAP